MHSTSHDAPHPRHQAHRAPLAVAAALSVTLAWGMTASAAVPVFGGSESLPLLCEGDGEPAGDSSPGSLDLVGDATRTPVSVNHDEHFLYFRYRVDSSPVGPGGFDQAAWVALVQVPDGDPFQYQYAIALNGKGSDDDFGNSGDTIELWANTTAMDIDFSPIFQDTAEVRLFAQKFDYVSLATVNEAPLAAASVTGDGSAFGGTPDHFVDFAIPVSVLLEKGVVDSPEQLDDLLFFPAASTNSNNYNKDILDGCSFLPNTMLSLSKTAVPAAIPANAAASVSYDIVVTNTGARAGRGVVIEDADAAAILSDLEVAAGATATVESTDPVRVTVENLPVGESVTVTVSGTVTAPCGAAPVNVATAFATNASEQQADATLIVGGDDALETCDGFDNDCDGAVDEGGDVTCDDGNACTADACVAGACVNTQVQDCVPCAIDGDCNDGNTCTTDTCLDGVCAVAALPGCIPCATDTDCHDGNTCTADACVDGACSITALPGCIPCATDGDCSDGDTCTTDTCVVGACSIAAIPGCVPCATDTDCHDGNACTADVCADGTCANLETPGCVPCATDVDCHDGNACTADACTDGVCANLQIDFCTPCDADEDCGDGNSCTVDSCQEGVCGHDGIDGCVPCATGADCNDGDPCTDDVCGADSTCEASPVEGCIPCTTDGDCHDGDACTSDQCGTDGSCVVTTIPGCVPCDTDADCTDDDACTTDSCLAGACVNRTDPDCSECVPSAEICGDGIDNDCDEATDCADANCAEAPACQGPVEICGDCIDNDGDGFVDLDDPDCGCVEPDPLDLRQLRIKTKDKVRKKRLKVRGVWEEALSVGLDPRESGLTLQLTDDSGTLFCSHFADDGWKRKGQKRAKYRHRDKTTASTNGMRIARFKVNKKGRVIFTARGPRAQLTMPSAGPVKVSVQVGETCRVSSAEMRSKRRKLVFP